MKKTIVITLLALLAMPAIYSQIKIGDNPQNIDAASVLELESNDRVLVITRINTAQMNAIVPNQGAMVYNTDTQCIHYFDGAQWINLCNSAGLEFTTDPIVNDVSTIVITDQAGTKNFEVAPNSIGTEQIINGGINGVDIQNGSIGPGKLQNQSVTQDKLSENSVGAFALDNDNIGLSAFNNDVGFITGANIVSGDTGNNIMVGGDNGAFYDNQPVLDAIDANTTAINAHIAADADTNANNEIQTLTLSGNDLGITGGNTITLPGGGNPNDELITNMVLNGSNQLVITEGGSPNTVDLSSLAGGGGTDGVVSNVVYSAADNNLTFTGANGGFNGVINLDDLDGGGSTTDTDTDDGLSDFDPTNGYDVLVDDVSIEINTSDQLQVKDAGITAAKINDMGAANGEVLKWNGTTWAPDIDNAGTGSTVDTDTDDGLSDFNPTTGYDVQVDDSTIEISATDQLQVKDAGITATKLNDMGATADGEILEWNTALNAGAGGWEVATPASGVINEQNIALDVTDNEIDLVNNDATIASSVKLDGSTINAINNGTDDVIQIADDGVTLDKIAHPDPTASPPPANGDIMVWDNDNLVWKIDAQAGEHTGTAKAIFYADDDPANLGKPTTTDDNTNPNDDGGLVWDTGARQLGSNTYGALHVGLQAGSPDVGNNSKVVIIERIANGHAQQGLAFPLQIQNENGTNTGDAAAGVLFAVDAGGGHGKGGVVLERKGAWGVGDFHFLLNQDNTGASLPTIADKAFTVKNNKDVRLYGGIDVDGTPTGLGGNNQVLTSTGSGVIWTDKGGNSVTDSDANDGLSTYVATTGYNVNVDDSTIEINGDALRIKADGITTNEIRNGEIQTDDLEDFSVTTAKIDNGTILSEDFSALGATTSGQVLKWDGTAWSAGTDNGTAYAAGEALSETSGTFDVLYDDTTVGINGSNQLEVKNNAITTDKIDAGAVESSDLSALGATTSGQVLKWDGTAWSAGTDNGTAYTAGEALDETSGTFDVLYDDTTVGINGSNQLEVKGDAITTDKISDGEVQTNDIADDNVTVDKIAASATDGHVLTTSGTDVVWATAQNFAASDLTLTGPRTHSLAGNNLIFGGGGNVAIGTLPGVPQSKLDVDGQVRARNGIAASEGTAGNPGYAFHTNNDMDTGMFRIAENQLGFSTFGTEALRIDATQNVGIGISPTERLHVNGNILATGTITPDYVFQSYFDGSSTLKPDYEMQSLEEVEKFVRKNKHLIGVPSAKAVEARGGILVNRATEINLEKIEELFLHTIEQEKKIKALQSENDTLTNELNSVKKELEEIKAMLKKLN